MPMQIPKKNNIFAKKACILFSDVILYRSGRKTDREPGVLAQLGERYTGSVEVSGSIPLCSTISNKAVEPYRFYGFLFYLSKTSEQEVH